MGWDGMVNWGGIGIGEGEGEGEGEGGDSDGDEEEKEGAIVHITYPRTVGRRDRPGDWRFGRSTRHPRVMVVMGSPSGVEMAGSSCRHSNHR